MLNLNKCDTACTSCIRSYKKKHHIQNEKKAFKIVCEGIPTNYVGVGISDVLGADEILTAETVLDPVKWAAETLDWHCLDPEGAIWKKKNPKEYEDWVAAHPDESPTKHSRYHRPYQASVLRCASKRKVMRLGRRLGKTDSLVVSTLYHAFVKPGLPEKEGFRVVIMAPFQVQIDTIFKRIEALIQTSPELANSIKHKVKSPIYMIELHNGSTIKGFTAGTKSNDGALSIRGQDAHMLLMDEADYLNPEDMDSALSIILDHPDAVVIVSSTPRGTREKFYQICYDRMYKEFYAPTTAHPMWNEDMEQFFRSNLTEMGYRHEIEAIFGEAEEGVFQHSYLDIAMFDYVYAQMVKQPNWIYGIGVDWNDTRIGTNITVVGYDPATKAYYIVDRKIVSREGWTQLSACQKIVEMNQLWRPAFIYIDRGYGSTQLEILHKHGHDSMADPSKGPAHPDSNLAQIVKAYDFGGSVEVHDLITKQPIKKAAKPFLVENTVRYFEGQVLHYSKHDELLDKQLRGYIIKRVTPTGIPVYEALDTKVGDHALDSLMLAMVGFTLEKTDFGKPKFSVDFAFCGRLGERTSPDTDTIGITVENKKEEVDRKKFRPEMNRTGQMESQSVLGTKGLPAANTTTEEVKLWTWPGWGHDAPKPSLNSRTFSGRIRTTRPTRKNI